MTNEDVLKAVQHGVKKTSNDNREQITKLLSDYFRANGSASFTDAQMNAGSALVKLVAELNCLATMQALADLGVLNVD